MFTMHDERICNRCGSGRAQVIAQSASPPGVLVRCRDCGVSSLRPLNGTPPPTPPATPSAADVDARRIERLVNTVITGKRLPCQLLSVDRHANRWRVAVRTQVGDHVKFEMPAESLSVMRAAIEQALAAET